MNEEKDIKVEVVQEVDDEEVNANEMRDPNKNTQNINDQEIQFMEQKIKAMNLKVNNFESLNINSKTPKSKHQKSSNTQASNTQASNTQASNTQASNTQASNTQASNTQALNPQLLDPQPKQSQPTKPLGMNPQIMNPQNMNPLSIDLQLIDVQSINLHVIAYQTASIEKINELLLYLKTMNFQLITFFAINFHYIDINSLIQNVANRKSNEYQQLNAFESKLLEICFDGMKFDMNINHMTDNYSKLYLAIMQSAQIAHAQSHLLKPAHDNHRRNLYTNAFESQLCPKITLLNMSFRRNFKFCKNSDTVADLVVENVAYILRTVASDSEEKYFEKIWSKEDYDFIKSSYKMEDIRQKLQIPGFLVFFREEFQTFKIVQTF